MMKHKVFVTRCRESFPTEVMEKLEASCEVSYWKDDSVIPPQQLSGRHCCCKCSAMFFLFHSVQCQCPKMAEKQCNVPLLRECDRQGCTVLSAHGQD